MPPVGTALRLCCFPFAEAFGARGTTKGTVPMRSKLLISAAALLAGMAMASAQTMPQGGAGQPSPGAAPERSAPQPSPRGGQAQQGQDKGKAQGAQGQAQDKCKARPGAQGQAQE